MAKSIEKGSDDHRQQLSIHPPTWISFHNTHIMKKDI